MDEISQKMMVIFVMLKISSLYQIIYLFLF